MKISNVVIIDDEPNFITSLETLLKVHFPEFNLIGKASSVAEAVALLKMTNPSLVFLDISLPDGTGFDILEQIEKRTFKVVFTTSYSKHAVRAFEVSALHYLMKPITKDKLQEALERFKMFITEEDKFSNFGETNLTLLKESLIAKPEKIMLPTSKKGRHSNEIYNISDILYCEANGSYTQIHLINDKKILEISKNLLALDKTLGELDFVRLHDSYLVNMRYIKNYNTGTKPTVTLTNNVELQISLRKKQEFILKLNNFVKTI